MKKLHSKWVLCLLTVDRKQQLVKDSEYCLQLFQHNKEEFLCKYVTMDKTWIHHFTLESNQQSAEWTAVSESHPKQSKMQTSTGKVLASVFWDAPGILFIDYLEKGRTINSKYHIALLMHLKEESSKKWPQKKKKKVLLHQNNALCHKSITTMTKYMNCTSIASAPTLFSRSRSQATTGCLQTSKECSGDRDLAPTKK